MVMAILEQSKIPLFHTLQKHVEKKAQSFHVPGHKNGMIFPEIGKDAFRSILPYDLTEITGLDDLHHPEGAIKEAQDLTADLYGADKSYFLVGGSTVGNLAMILSACKENDQVIVQRNSHKSIMHALELSGVQPIFVTPLYDDRTKRYSLIKEKEIIETIFKYPNAKAVILTYPNYFGNTYDIKSIIDAAHQYQIPVLVDEAHGAHFILGKPFPPSSLSLGADVVVQSAHKMLPAMTMSSYLHIKSKLVDIHKLEYYLQVLQSSSPSYPLLASLDLARYFLANLMESDINNICRNVSKVREVLKETELWTLLPIEENVDDPLKITLHIESSEKLNMIVHLLEQFGVYPELTTTNQILLIHGLGEYIDIAKLAIIKKELEKQLKNKSWNDTIQEDDIYVQPITELPMSYSELKTYDTKWVSWQEAEGCIAQESVTPYPPGIPFLLKGERITEYHIQTILTLIKNGRHIHYQGKDLQSGIHVTKWQ
jgi:arginine decarboxylase